jgi:hypothetical protein
MVSNTIEIAYGTKKNAKCSLLTPRSNVSIGLIKKRKKPNFPILIYRNKNPSWRKYFSDPKDTNAKKATVHAQLKA